MGSNTIASIKMHMVTGPSGGRKSTASVSVVQQKRLVKIQRSTIGAIWNFMVAIVRTSEWNWFAHFTDLPYLKRIWSNFHINAYNFGSPIFEANIDDGSWQTYPLEGYANLDQVGQSVQI